MKELKTVDGWSVSIRQVFEEILCYTTSPAHIDEPIAYGQTFSEKKLLAAPEATSDEIHGEALMSNLLSLPVACAVRIGMSLWVDICFVHEPTLIFLLAI